MSPGPPTAAVTSSPPSSSIAIGVGATDAAAPGGATSARWRAVASSSDSPARTFVCPKATAAQPKASRLRQRAIRSSW
jgi:hypothetical protein